MTDDRAADIASRLALARERIRAAAADAGRVDAIDLVVVTKTFPAADVVILADLGVTDIAENKDQEARAKRDETEATSTIRWHMIGRLQRNKIASVARWADAVDSVDRIEVVAPLGAAAASTGRRIDVLVQVGLDQVTREGRGGVNPSDAIDLAAAIVSEPGLRLRGVMGIAPFPGDPAAAFGLLGTVAAHLRSRWPGADCISAGMSGDLEIAIAHGATQVRVGGAILGQRTRVQ